MIQEDKNLLLIDLCARLPYHPIVYVNENLPRLKLGVSTRVWEYIGIDKPCKPYLRPMSSMTEEEEKEYEKCYQSDDTKTATLLVDFYNKKHFDYRGLIKRGLAIEAPEGMYNLKVR